jgi:hypothetical protein
MGASLITLAEYKSYAGIKGESQDVQIASLITKVSEYVKTYCRRTFVDYVSANKVDYFDGGTSLLWLEESPIIEIVSVESSIDFGDTWTTYTDWVLKRKESILVPRSLYEFPYAVNGYKVTYKCGYATLPEDLKLACMDLLKYYLSNDSAVKSNKAPGTNSVQIEYVSTNSLPANIKRVLDLYKEHYG